MFEGFFFNLIFFSFFSEIAIYIYINWGKKRKL